MKIGINHNLRLRLIIEELTKKLESKTIKLKIAERKLLKYERNNTWNNCSLYGLKLFNLHYIHIMNIEKGLRAEYELFEDEVKDKISFGDFMANPSQARLVIEMVKSIIVGKKEKELRIKQGKMKSGIW